jgi:hypothetical protein
MGWDGVKNGQLLLLAGHDFEVFLTGDKNLRYQQNLDHPADRHRAAAHHALADACVLQVAAIQSAMEAVQPGQFIEVSFA